MFTVLLFLLQAGTMFYEGLHFLKGLPSPEGVWERVQVIGELQWSEYLNMCNGMICCKYMEIGRVIPN